MKTLAKIFLVLAIAVSAIETGAAQDKKIDKKAAKIEEIKQLVKSQNYLFKAQFMYPMSGMQQFLNTDYDVKVRKDTLESFLPYFGVAYAGAAYNNRADAGIQFTSTKFDYSLQEKTNGSYTVFIKVRDSKTTAQMILDITSTGYASLSVQSYNRQVIRFSGYVDEIPKPKV